MRVPRNHRRSSIAITDLIAKLLALTVVILCVDHASGQTSAGKKPAEIDAATIAAYKKLGGVYGTFRWPHQWPTHFEAGIAPTGPDDLPGFRFEKCPGAKLPDAGVPFAVEWAFYGPGDADLLKLADLRNLAFLEFSGAEATKAGLAVFDNFKDLRWLSANHDAMTIAWITKFKGLMSLSTFVQSDADLLEIGKLSALKILSFSGGEITDKGLEPLGKLEHLVDLHLDQYPITGVGFKGFKKLEQLHLGDSGIDDSGMTALGKLTGLTHLQMESKKVTDKGWAELKKVTNLKHLDLGHASITDAGLKFAKHLRLLESLRLRSTKITDAGLLELEGCKKLTSLRIYGVPITDAGIASLRRIANLELLDVRAAPLTDAKLSDLQSLDHLNELILDEKQFTDKLLEAFRTGGKLHVLYSFSRGTDGRAATDAEITRAYFPSGTSAGGISVIRDLKNLESLQAHGDAITDGALGHLVALHNLTELDLYETAVTKVGLAKLAHLKKLSALSLTRSAVADDAIAVLKEFRGLKSLKLYDTKVTDARLIDLTEIAGLHTLGVWEKQLSDRMLAAFREKGKLHILSSCRYYSDPPVPSDAEITHIELGKSAVTDEGLRELRGLKKLTGIRLYDTAVTDAGMPHLSGFEKLAYLDLWGTKVTGKGLTSIARLNLTALSLGRSKVVESDIPTIRRFKNLESLDLSELRFDIDELKRLQRDMPQCEIRW